MIHANRNLGGMPYPANRYYSPAIQDAAWASLIRTCPEIITAQEATGFGRPFEPPAGWRAKPFHPLDRIGGSVVAVADAVDADLDWRPSHPVIDTFGAYLDFTLVELWNLEVAVVSLHVPPKWYPHHWEGCGLPGPIPTGRPWTCDVILDTLIEVLAGRPTILAGDHNEALNFPCDGDPAAIAYFARAEAAGYVEVVNTTFRGPVRTVFTPRTVRSYQNDHVHVSADLVSRVEEVTVFNEPNPGRSDHAGIIVTFSDRVDDLAGAAGADRASMSA